MNTSQFSTCFGLFSVLNTDQAFYSSLSKGIPWDYSLIQTLINYIPDYGVILDIGSHIGTHAIPYAQNRPNCTIYCFEPQLKIRELLEKNINDNKINNIHVYPFGIGHANKDTYLSNNFISDGYPSDLKVNYDTGPSVNFGGLGITTEPSGEKIVIRTIDSMNIDNVSYVKIDIEGAETLAVFGARNTIQKYRPVLMIEQSDKSVFNLYKDDNEELNNFNINIFLESLKYSKLDLGDCNYLYIPN